MAGACSCESCCHLERLAGGFGGFGAFEGGQPAGLNAFKHRRLGHVAARVFTGKACGKSLREGLEGLERLKAGKRQA